MQEVDERVQWHVTAILRILSGCFAALGDRSEITRGFRSCILATLRPVESAVRRIVIYSAMRIHVQVRQGKPPQPMKPHACILRSLRQKALREAGERSEAKGEAEESSSQLPATPEQNCARALASSGLTVSMRQPAPRRRLLARWQDRSARPVKHEGRKFSRFSLFDPPRRMPAFTEAPVPVLQPPRISIPGVTQLRPLPARRTGTGLCNAAPLKARMEAVEAALNDLPSQGRRFARWWALRSHELARRKAEAASRPPQPLPSHEERAHNRRNFDSTPPPIRRRRLHALRIGRPPGCRLIRFDPDGRLPPGSREIDEILAHVDALAREACARAAVQAAAPEHDPEKWNPLFGKRLCGNK